MSTGERRANPTRDRGSAVQPANATARTEAASSTQHRPFVCLFHFAMGAAALFVAVTAGGCAQRDPSPEAKRKAAIARVTNAAIVAPVFEHGDGHQVAYHDSHWYVAVLSEEEALQVICEELARVGLEMTETDVPMEGVRIPHLEATGGTDWVSGGNCVLVYEGAIFSPLILDLKDSRSGVGVEFVSTQDDAELGWGGAHIWAGFKPVHYPADTARRVAQHVRENGRGAYIGVFYDPLCSGLSNAVVEESIKFELKKATEAVAGLTADEKGSLESRLRTCLTWGRPEEESRDLLREQVRDFIEWLKGQGVI